MLRQIEQGAAANCFHRAILFSVYLSSLGIKLRLWTLENDNFNNIAHSINEVYIRDFKKWVFIDVTFGFYVAENGIPLFLLEFRERLLMKLCFITEVKYKLVNLNTLGVELLLMENSVWTIYRRLIKCVFLRANNDFAAGYNHRYGIFNFAQQYIVRFSDNTKRGLDYLLERQKFIHYVDGFSKSLGPEVIWAKSFFYFFIFSSTGIGIFAAGFLLSWLKRRVMPV